MMFHTMFGLLFAYFLVTGSAGNCAGGSCTAGDDISLIQVDKLVKSGRDRQSRGDPDVEEMEKDVEDIEKAEAEEIDDVIGEHEAIDGEIIAAHDEEVAEVTGKAFTHRYRGPQDVMKCESPVYTTKCLTKETYNGIVKHISDIVDALGPYCPHDPKDEGDPTFGESKWTFGKCPQASWTGCVLRMAGHDFMDFDGKEGGADACTDMDNPDNAGLMECLATGEFGHSLNDVYGPVCEQVSLADFLVIAAEAVMVKARELAIKRQPNGNSVAPGGYSKLDFSGSFMYGRTTRHEDCTFTEGSLPNPQNGCDDVDRVFVKNMGLGDSEHNGTKLKNGMAAALMGVHTLGKAEKKNSGYEGWWSWPVNSREFTNDYYIAMIIQGWFPEEVKPGKNQWKKTCGPDREMMLNTDICLAWSNKDGEPLLAQRDNCCAWQGMPMTTWDGKEVGLPKEAFHAWLGPDRASGCSQGLLGPKAKQSCCNWEGRNPDAGEAEDCGPEGHYTLTGFAAEAVSLYASSDEAWMSDFKKAWATATTNGFAGQLHKLEDKCSS